MKLQPLNITSLKTGQSETDVDLIYSAIYDAVMDHRLPPGTKLTESIFCEYFQVTRTVIRKVLFMLSQKYIVDLRPNRGAIVAHPSIKETHDVFDTRRIVERAVMEAVMQSITKEKIKKLDQHIQQEEAAVKRQDRRDIVRLSGEFHILLASMQDNKVLYQYVSELISQTTLMVALYETLGSLTYTNHDHQKIVQFIKDNDWESAVKSMDKHLVEIESNLNLAEPIKDIDLADVFG